MDFVSHPLIKPDSLQHRLYQSSILSEAIHKNMLVVLPTGTGKTPIAILLAAQRLEKYPDSKILVLAPTRPLVSQHYKSFAKFMNIDPDKFCVVTGLVKPEERERFYKEKQLVFATPQCVTGDTVVFDSESGPISIEKLFMKMDLKPEKYGNIMGYSSETHLMLLGLSGDEIKPVRAIKAWKLSSKELIHIKTELMNDLKCTPEHPLLRINSDAGIEWIQAKDLKEGEFIGFARKMAIGRKEVDFYKILKNSRLRVCDREKINGILEMAKRNGGIKLSEYSRFKWNTMPLRLFLELHEMCNNPMPDEIAVTDWTAKSEAMILKRHLYPETAYLLGAFAGDGHIGDRKGHGGDVVFSDLDRPTVSEMFKNAVHKTFGIIPKQDEKKGLVYNSSALAEVLSGMGIRRGKKADTIRVPNFLFYADECCVASFLAGMFNADGYAGRHAITFSTASPDMASDIKWLLLRLGITSGVYIAENKNRTIRGKPVKDGVIYNTKIYGRRQIEKFLQLCNPEREKCGVLLKSLECARKPNTRSKDVLPIERALMEAYNEHRKNGGNPIRGHWESIRYYRSAERVSEFLKKLKSKKAREIEKIISLPLRWGRITSIEYLKENSWVYDFTIERDHNFIANHIVSHNTVQNDIENGRISLSEFSLLVTDEAHHSVGGYSYPFVAKYYLEHSKHPRLLGLTASPGGTKEKIREICANLGIEAVEIRAEHDADVAPYVMEKDISWEYVELPESFLKIRSLIDSLYKKRIESLMKLRLVRYSRASKKELLRVQAGLMSQLKQGDKRAFMGISLVSQAIKLDHALGLLESQGLQSLESYWAKLRASRNRGDKAIAGSNEIKAAMLLTNQLLEAGSTHPKMGKLCSIVHQELAKSPGSRIIVFASFRDTVKEVAGALSGVEGAMPVMLVGQKRTSRIRGQCEGLSQKEQTDVISRYESGEYNCLVCTSIGEEGLSLESADLAIFYEPVPSEIRTVQRRGRVGRIRTGRIIILITKDTRDEAYMWAAMHKEREMHRTLGRMRDQLSDEQRNLGGFT